MTKYIFIEQKEYKKVKKNVIIMKSKDIKRLLKRIHKKYGV